MKRIFIIQNTPLDKPLPLSVFLTNLLNRFPHYQDLEINLIAGGTDAIPKGVLALCRKVYTLPTSTYSIKDNIKFSLKVLGILKREHRHTPIDTIHCFYPNSSLLGAVLFKRFHHKEVSLIYDIRSPWIEMSLARGFVARWISSLYKGILYLEERILARRVDHFVFITDGLAHYYKKKIHINHSKGVTILPTGVDLELFQPRETDIREQYRVKDSDTLIVSVGGIAKIRQLDRFLHLFHEATTRKKFLKLMFVGDGDALEELKGLTAQLGISHKVIFTGSVPHREVPRYICAADFGLAHIPDLQVYRSSFALKILEYLGCGVPVLATRMEAHKEIKKKVDGVHLYTSANQLLIGLNTKIKRPVLQDLSPYSWKTIAEGYCGVYRGLP